MEEVRKKCEAVPKPPNEESAARARLWTARTKESFFSANGVLFLNVSEYACVLFALKGGTQARARSTEDGPQKNKKKTMLPLESNKQTGTKECRLRKVPGTGAFTSTGREATTSKGDVREKCACVCVCVLLRCVNKIVHLNGFA